jgi:hypothetical protein
MPATAPIHSDSSRRWQPATARLKQARVHAPQRRGGYALDRPQKYRVIGKADDMLRITDYLVAHDAPPGR